MALAVIDNGEQTLKLHSGAPNTASLPRMIGEKQIPGMRQTRIWQQDKGEAKFDIRDDSHDELIIVTFCSQ
jgi:hypothetical protein